VGKTALPMDFVSYLWIFPVGNMIFFVVGLR